MALLCAGFAAGQEQEQQTGFTADVNLVLLHVAVIDPRGSDVPPLSVEDFTVFDDGVKQTVELFVAPADAPLDVALVLDSSASMKPVEMLARRAALSFLGRLAPDDCAFVLPFSDTAGPGRWGRSADPDLRMYIGRIRSQGGTALHDALLEGLAQLERASPNDLVAVASEAEEGLDSEEREESGIRLDSEPPVQTAGPDKVAASGDTPVITLPPRRTSLLHEVGDAVRYLDLSAPPPVIGCGKRLPPGTLTTAANARRKALILLSDGADMDSKAGFYDALGAARAASVPVFPVAMGYANDDPSLKDHLEEIARATGGRMVQNGKPGELGESYDQVVSLLRSYYLIGYSPDRLGSPEQTQSGGRPRWHDVTVALRRPNFEPLVRPGYYR
ncbi:MAG: VWA domain-containing protein [Acidobacteria bacterium]|nr:VWA domain-containing protein [Acidobacteriota bacterium]